jgi:TolB protein
MGLLRNAVWVSLVLAVMSSLAALTAGAAGMLLPRRQIAFIMSPTGNNEIVTLDLRTRLLRNLTRHGAEEVEFAWSPDGSQIAFISNRDRSREIYLMTAAGGDLRQLTHTETDSTSPVWSPDGSQIAYQFDVSFEDADEEIYILNVATGRRRNLSNSPAVDHTPLWSPDGRRIAFISDRSDRDPTAFISDLFLMNADGGDLRQLTDLGGQVDAPIWSPNGREILFTSRQDDRLLLLAVNTANGQVRQVAKVGAFSPDWSPDGELAFFTYLAGGAQIQRLYTDGSIRQVSNFTNGMALDWSPDGRELVFVWVGYLSTRGSSRGSVRSIIYRYQISTINPDGSQWRAITDGTSGVAFPRWRPG